MSTVPKPGATKPLTPERQIKALQVQLREANEKAQLLEAIVDVLKEGPSIHSALESIPLATGTEPSPLYWVKPSSSMPESAEGLRSPSEPRTQSRRTKNLGICIVIGTASSRRC
nr:hypothetical protein [Stenotrophomonas maltophilia]